MREGAHPEWRSDADFGRQVLAGQNCCVVELVRDVGKVTEGVKAVFKNAGVQGNKFS